MSLCSCVGFSYFPSGTLSSPSLAAGGCTSHCQVSSPSWGKSGRSLLAPPKGSSGEEEQRSVDSFGRRFLRHEYWIDSLTQSVEFVHEYTMLDSRKHPHSCSQVSYYLWNSPSVKKRLTCVSHNLAFYLKCLQLEKMGTKRLA